MGAWGKKNWGLNAPLCHTEFILACQATFLILSVIILQTIYSSKLFFSTRFPVRDPILSDPDFVDVLPFQSITTSFSNARSHENEDHENEDLITKTKTPRKKTKTPYENEKPSRKRRHITKTSSKEVGITFVDKDYVHETHHENEDPYRNLEFWIWHFCSLLRNISKGEPHGTFNGSTLKLKRDFRRG